MSIELTNLSNVKQKLWAREGTTLLGMMINMNYINISVIK